MTSYTLLSCIDSRVEHLTKFYGRFELGPFAPGQGLTVANALRRSLLSELSGTAITLVEVRGASNEYEILTGVRESILDILLNLKQIIFTSDFEIFSPQIGFLNVEGPGVIRSNDLKLPSFIYSVDPNQYIATLSNKGRLNLKFLICCGKNYITYNPNDAQYSEWLSLLKNEKPLINFNNLKNLEKPTINYLINSLVSDPTKKNFLSNDSKTLLKKDISLNNTLPIPQLPNTINSIAPTFFNFSYFSPCKSKGQKSIGQKHLSNQNYSTILKEKSIISPTNFYKQWKKERNSLKAAFDGRKDSLAESNSQFPENTKKLQAKLMQSFKKTNFSDPFFCKGKSKKSIGEILPKNQNFKGRFDQKNLSFVQEKANLTQLFQITENSNKIGYFPIDALFMPITRVNYLIESTGNLKLPQDNVILEIWTNGSIHPRYAIHKAAKALIQLFLPFQQMRTPLFQIAEKKIFEIDENERKKNNEEINKQIALKKNIKIKLPNELKKRDFDRRVLELDIGNLELTARPYSCLKMANINTIEDLLSYSKEELLLFKNFGERSLREVEKALQLMKLTLR